MQTKKKLILIGASTGGPGHIKKLVKDLVLGEHICIIAQHMQSDFFPSYAAALAADCVSPVRLLTAPQFLDSGIYLCGKNIQLGLNGRAAPNDGSFPFSPNVDLLFSSAAKICSSYDTLAMLLTGIGDDGAKGLYELYKAGAKCIGEAQKSCIVYGMPKRAYELNPALKQLEIDQIKIALDEFLRS